jgi:hypothetical protein
MDNQTARVFAGQLFPITLGSTATATGVISATVQQQSVGVQLSVTPRISPDGKIIMRVTPEVSSTAPTNVMLGNGITATAVNQQTVDTTVIAGDGETVALGGLITKRDDKTENKVPWLGDLPGVGVLFRYRTQAKTKVELLIIMTPHIVRSRLDADRILANESRRIDWVVGDVLRIQGTSGMEPILPPPGAGPGGAGGAGAACTPANSTGSVVIPSCPRPEPLSPNGMLPTLPKPGAAPLPRRLPPPNDQSQQGPAVNPATPLTHNPSGLSVNTDVAPAGGTASTAAPPPQGASTNPAPSGGSPFIGSAPVPEDGNGSSGPRVTTVTTPLVPVTQEAQPAAPHGKESQRWSPSNKH